MNVFMIFLNFVASNRKPLTLLKKRENYNISIFAKSRCVNICVNDVSQIIHSKIVKKLYKIFTVLQ